MNVLRRILRALSAPEPVGVNLARPFDPRGNFVYALWDDADRLLYVGQSANVLARLGVHMSNQDRRSKIAAVTVMRCETRDIMHDTEQRLIREHAPPWNIRGVNR